MSKTTTKATIDANIKQNGTQAITGQILNSVLTTMVDDYGAQEEVTALTNQVFKEELVSVYDIQSENVSGTQGRYTSFGLFSTTPRIGDHLRIHVVNSGFACSSVWVGLLNTSWQPIAEIETRAFTGDEDIYFDVNIASSGVGAVSFRPLEWGTSGDMSVECWIVNTQHVVEENATQIQILKRGAETAGVLPLLVSSEKYASYDTNSGGLWPYSGAYPCSRPINVEGVKRLLVTPSRGFVFLYYSEKPAGVGSAQPNYMGGQYQVESFVPAGAKYVVVGFSNASIGEYTVSATREDLIYVDCLGDSLTMGTQIFGFYVDSLQNRLGRRYEVRNWGVGGENSASIMGRQGSSSVHASSDFVLKSDKSETTIATGALPSAYGNAALLLQGSLSVVNPCYVQGIECTLRKDGENYKIKRNTTGTRNITMPQNTPILMNTGKKMAKASISVVWIGTNDADLSVDERVNLVKKCVEYLSNTNFVVIGAHGISDIEEQNDYEGKMTAAFGNKFFNIREYSTSNMIYDAGITPTSQDLSRMAARQHPLSLCVSDGFHFNPAANEVIGKRLYEMFIQLGYITEE